MGKFALLLVLALSLTVGYIALTLNNSKSTLIENVSGFDKYTNARNIAHTGVNMFLRRLDKNDPTVDSLNAGKQVVMSVNAMAGACSLWAKLKNPASLDTVDLRVRSQFMDSTRFMKIRLWRHPVPFPVFDEAVALHVPDVDFQMVGSALIDGRNHTVDGTLITPMDSNSVPGVGVLDPTDSVTVSAYGSKINGTQDVVANPNLPDPTDYVQEYINAADYVYTSGVYNSYTWGSPTNPVIVYCNGDVKFNGNATGWGLLVVQGDLTLAGTFDWHGPVICYNSTTIDVQFAAGTPNIYGAVLMAGPPGSQFVMKGNPSVAYSKDALNMAKYINKLQVYRVVAWYESWH